MNKIKEEQRANEYLEMSKLHRKNQIYEYAKTLKSKNDSFSMGVPTEMNTMSKGFRATNSRVDQN